MKIITLTGFMGCGKSSIGAELSRQLGCPFADLDGIIEEIAGRTVSEIFSDCGEAGFRLMEREALGEVIDSLRGEAGLYVLALGGGTLTAPGCAELVQEGTFCVYLRAREETLVENLRGAESGRPMLAGGDGLEAKVHNLLSARSSLYEGCAAAIVDVDGKSYSESAEDIIETLSKAV